MSERKSLIAYGERIVQVPRVVKDDGWQSCHGCFFEKLSAADCRKVRRITPCKDNIWVVADSKTSNEF